MPTSIRNEYDMLPPNSLPAEIGKLANYVVPPPPRPVMPGAGSVHQSPRPPTQFRSRSPSPHLVGRLARPYETIEFSPPAFQVGFLRHFFKNKQIENGRLKCIEDTCPVVTGNSRRGSRPHFAERGAGRDGTDTPHILSAQEIQRTAGGSGNGIGVHGDDSHVCAANHFEEFAEFLLIVVVISSRIGAVERTMCIRPIRLGRLLPYS